MEPSERGCIKCGYNLAGLPAAGTVVTCPECGLATDLAYRSPRRKSWSSPVWWGTVPAALGFLCVMLNRTIRDGSGTTELFLLVAGLFGGAITAGVMKYKMVGRERGKGRALRPFWVRVALSVWAAALSVIANAALRLIVLTAFGGFSLV